MRELKFRAWDKKNKVMVYQGIRGLGQFFDHIIRPNNQYEVMQFVGLKDKYGKEIYTGDIIEMIRIKDEKNRFVYFVGQVTDHGVAGITIDAKNDYMDFECKDYSYEVIGNVYENPELLK